MNREGIMCQQCHVAVTFWGKKIAVTKIPTGLEGLIGVEVTLNSGQEKVN